MIEELLSCDPNVRVFPCDRKAEALSECGNRGCLMLNDLEKSGQAHVEMEFAGRGTELKRLRAEMGVENFE